MNTAPSSMRAARTTTERWRAGPSVDWPRRDSSPWLIARADWIMARMGYTPPEYVGVKIRTNQHPRAVGMYVLHHWQEPTGAFPNMCDIAKVFGNTQHGSVIDAMAVVEKDANLRWRAGRILSEGQLAMDLEARRAILLLAACGRNG